MGAKTLYLTKEGRRMKTLILSLAFLATGCATQNERALQACCQNQSGTASGNFSAPSRSQGAYQVITPAGGYLVVPNASTGMPMSIIQTSKGRK